MQTWPSYLYSTVYSCSELPQYLKQEPEKVVAEIGNWEAMCEHLGVHKAVLSGLRNIIDTGKQCVDTMYIHKAVLNGFHA